MKIGNLKFNQPITLAPMEDVTDEPFRYICKKLGADIVYTEFTSSEALIRNIERAFQKITINDQERPVGIQLFGGIEDSMEQAASVAESFGPDIIDINCGCYVKNHVARGEGAALLKDLPRFERIVKSTVRGTSLPVTVKTRLGWDQDDICILDVARMVEQAGAQALTVHCRVRTQGHRGKADWDWLTKIKKVITIPLIGNGDLYTPQDVKTMFETGCDGVMIGRGAINNPWIFVQAKHYLKTGKMMPEIPLKQRVELCLEHLKLNCQKRSEKFGVPHFRKYYSGYLCGLPNIAQLRKELMQIRSVDGIEERMYKFLKETPCLNSGNDESQGMLLQT